MTLSRTAILGAVVSLVLAGGVALLLSGNSGVGGGSGWRAGPGGARTGVEWCVEFEPEDNIQLQLQAKEQIEKLLPLVRADEEAWQRSFEKPARTSFVSSLPDVVESGCPVGPAAFDPVSGDDKIGDRGVSSPGRFSLLIYILPERPIERALGRKGDRLTSEEHQCFGDVCETTASGLYLMEEEVSDPALVKYWLYEAIGLGCYRPADAIRPFESRPTGDLNPSDYCDE
jgi:hypothetical protein